MANAERATTAVAATVGARMPARVLADPRLGAPEKLAYVWLDSQISGVERSMTVNFTTLAAALGSHPASARRWIKGLIEAQLFEAREWIENAIIGYLVGPADIRECPLRVDSDPQGMLPIEATRAGSASWDAASSSTELSTELSTDSSPPNLRVLPDLSGTSTSVPSATSGTLGTSDVPQGRGGSVENPGATVTGALDDLLKRVASGPNLAERQQRAETLISEYMRRVPSLASSAAVKIAWAVVDGVIDQSTVGGVIAAMERTRGKGELKAAPGGYFAGTLKNLIIKAGGNWSMPEGCRSSQRRREGGHAQ